MLFAKNDFVRIFSLKYKLHLTKHHKTSNAWAQCNRNLLSQFLYFLLLYTLNTKYFSQLSRPQFKITLCFILQCAALNSLLVTGPLLCKKPQGAFIIRFYTQDEIEFFYARDALTCLKQKTILTPGGNLNKIKSNLGNSGP